MRKLRELYEARPIGFLYGCAALCAVFGIALVWITGHLVAGIGFALGIAVALYEVHQIKQRPPGR